MKNLNLILDAEEKIIHGPNNEVILLGFLWQPIEKELTTNEIVNRVKKFFGNYYIVNRGQIGSFSFNGEESLINSFCGACLFRDFLGDKNTLCLLKMEEDIYWVLGIYDSKVVPGADNCFENLEEARSRFEILLGYFKWDLFVISTELSGLINIDLHEGCELKEVNVSVIIKELNFANAHQVSSISSSNWVHSSANTIIKKVNLGISFLVLFLLAGLYVSFRYISYYKHQKQEELLRNLSRDALIEERNKWKKQPTLESAIKIIDNELSRLPIIIAGWKIVQGSLSNNSFIVTYKPQNSDNFDYFSKKMENMGFECIYNSQKNLAVVKKICKIETSPNNTILNDIVLCNTKIKSILNGKVKVNGYIKPVIKLSTGVSSFDFCLQSSLSPSVLFKDRDLKGITSNEVEFTFKNNNITWKILGKCYGKN